MKSLEAVRKKSSLSEEPTSCANYEIGSEKLQIDADGNILIRKNVSRFDENQWAKIEIRNKVLPATPLNSEPTSMSNRRELVLALVAACDVYLARVTPTKSTHLTLIAQTNVIAKFFEYSWLNGIYSLSDWRPAFWDSFRDKLSQGGWVYALDIERRTRDLLTKMPTEEIGSYLVPSHESRGHKFSLRSSFLRKLGTNVAGREVNLVRKIVESTYEARRLGNESIYSQKGSVEPLRRVSTSLLRQDLMHLNTLADIPSSLGVDHVPTASPWRYSLGNGRTLDRTKNFTPDTLAALLKQSFYWVEELSEPVIDLLESLGELAVETNHLCYSWTRKRFHQHLAESHGAVALQEILGLKITTFVAKNCKSGETSVKNIVMQLAAACFFLIALMNARRKDEISHRSIGLHANSLTLVDKDLELNLCEFYIEKSARDYVPFYVNATTKKCIEIMKKVSDVAWTLNFMAGNADFTEQSYRDRKIFCLPSFVGQKSSAPLFFDFSSVSDGGANEFLRNALGSAKEFKVRPHMARRAYGLLFHYRYEHGGLHALAQQYGHFDLSQVRTYVTDSELTAIQETGAALWRNPTGLSARVYEKEFAEIDDQVKEVGDEKLKELIRAILDGGARVSGGYEKLINRFNKKLSLRVAYEELDATRKAELVSQMVIAKGHHPKPMVHGTCMASGRERLGRCYSPERRELARERAKAHTCGHCIYHACTSTHLQHLRQDVERLENLSKNSEPLTLQERIQHQELQNLKRIIVIHEKKLGNE